MSKINNMGGVLFADILSGNEISLFAVHNDSAYIRATEGHDWHILPTVNVIEAPTVSSTESDAGITYKHSVTIRFASSVLTPEKAHELQNRIIEGCILRCQDVNGSKFICGTDHYLLFGTLNRIIGKKTTDFSGYELKLSGTSQYPLLQYLPI